MPARRRYLELDESPTHGLIRRQAMGALAEAEHLMRHRTRPLNAIELAAVASALGPRYQPKARGPLGVQA